MDSVERLCTLVHGLLNHVYRGWCRETIHWVYSIVFLNHAHRRIVLRDYILSSSDSIFEPYMYIQEDSLVILFSDCHMGAYYPFHGLLVQCT